MSIGKILQNDIFVLQFHIVSDTQMNYADNGIMRNRIEALIRERDEVNEDDSGFTFAYVLFVLWQR